MVRVTMNSHKDSTSTTTVKSELTDLFNNLKLTLSVLQSFSKLTFEMRHLRTVTKFDLGGKV